MNSMLRLAFVIVILTVWDSTMGSKETDHHGSAESDSKEPQRYVRCDQLPKESLNPADLLRIASFTFTQTISPDFNCTKAVIIKPISPDVDYSIIFAQGDRVFYYDVNSTDCDKTATVTECLTGIKASWHFYRARLGCDTDGCDTDGYYCPYYCSSDGYSLQQFTCVSAGNSVNPEIKNVIEYIKSNVPGADTIFDAKANCPPPKCTFF